MDNKQFKIPENVTNVDQMKGFMEAMTAFFEQLLILNKSLETMAKDTKDIKDYFTLANGFQKDSKIMQEEILEKLLDKMKEDTDAIKLKIEDNMDGLKEKIDDAGYLLSKSLFNKVLGLALAGAGSLSVIFYSVERILFNSSVQDIVQEVLKVLQK